MLTINQILGPHSVQSEKTLWWRTLVLDRKKSRGKRGKEGFYYIYTYYYDIYIFYVQAGDTYYLGSSPNVGGL